MSRKALAAEDPEQAPAKRHVLWGVPEGHDARFLARRAHETMAGGGAVLHIALDSRRTSFLCETLSIFAPDIEVLTFPAWDCLPYDRVSPHPEITGQRADALRRMQEWQKDTSRKPRIVLTTVNAALQRVPPRESVAGKGLEIRENGACDPEQLIRFLEQEGYIRTGTVRETGEYAVRGGIIDLFPAGRENPVRIDLFGDQVETLKSFDSITQRSLERLKQIDLSPVSELQLDQESIARFRQAYRNLFGAIRNDTDTLYETISAGRMAAGAEHFLPLFHEHMETLFDYLPEAQLFLDSQAEPAASERVAHIHDFYQARKEIAANRQNTGQQADLRGNSYNPIPPEMLYLDESELGRHGGILLSPFARPDGDAGSDEGARRGRDFADIRARQDGEVFTELRAHIGRLQLAGKAVLLAAYSTGSRERIRHLLEQKGQPGLKTLEHYDRPKLLKPGETGMICLSLESGFEAPDLAVISEQDILGERLVRRTPKRKKDADAFIREVSSLSEGDLVVHEEHGVGRFEGLVPIEAAGTVHDCVKLIYAGDDKLFVPVENLDVLSRYGADEAGTAQLDKLGGAAWQARKAKVKKDLMEMAGKLMDIAAARKLRPGPDIELDQQSYQEFAARFPYPETEDQARAIDQTLEDLQSGPPMDRLICGDVGFGKTEVAMRAAFAAALNGKQVALICPTTLLARQHWASFQKRLEGFPVKVAMLSRLVSQSESQKIKKNLQDGKIDIVIGTHALLGQNVKFQDLGLVIVDEEQRFGVKQKEKLKELKKDVHVMTLTATPIPRTLQMSLTGVRDLSLITTPPVDRLAVRSFVLPYDPVVVREAIMREYYRGGQVFCVCPRIHDMPKLEEHLKELVPEVKVITAHGQMGGAELEERMQAFLDGNAQLLLATNIIESGLDIPSANTLIVHRADMFGLSQLYQIRGRVGRSKLRGYAYLTYDPKKVLTENAKKRLEVLGTLDQLGAGFQLASHDMDIRGAGNLLGDQQSGHIREVGVELYQQMLEEAVAAAREGAGLDEAATEEGWSPNINLGTSVLIPEGYVPDLNLRMSLYRRLASLTDEQEIEAFAAELIDRFGELPGEVENLLDIVRIKQLCKQAGVEKLEAGPKGALITFRNNTPANPDKALHLVQQKPGIVKLRPDQKLGILGNWPRTGQRVEAVRGMLKALN